MKRLRNLAVLAGPLFILIVTITGCRTTTGSMSADVRTSVPRHHESADPELNRANPITVVPSIFSGGMVPHDIGRNPFVIAVRRTPEGVFAEIDAGSRDGVRRGWILTITHDGRFIANLRIETVGRDQSTGKVLLEDESRSGLVQVGHQVIATAANDTGGSPQ